MTDPAPRPQDPLKRSTTGAIPLNWAMPAEMSVNAAGLEQKASSPKVRPQAPRSRVGIGAVTLAVSISLGLVVGVFFDDIVSSLRATLERSESPLATRVLDILPTPDAQPSTDAAATGAPGDSPQRASTDSATTTLAEASDGLVPVDVATTTGDPRVEPAAIDASVQAAAATALPGAAEDTSDDVIEEIRHGDVLALEAAPRPADTAATIPAVAPVATADASQSSPPAKAPAVADDVAAASPAPPTEAPTETVVRLSELPVRKKVRQMVTKAEGLIKEGRHDDAVLLLQRAELVDASYPLLHRTRGIAEASRGQTDAARAAYRRYLRRAPNAPDAADVRRILGE
jgi:hypothetical protein